ncbi:hypothetical protein AC1031_002193 [Aphanomyces cochlioides]|nr:hypothetical protein AC1031_002193 [Aphanomyces cochlioides]
MDGETLDIEADLQFLIATDEELHRGLLRVVDILEDEADVDEACSRTRVKKAETESHTTSEKSVPKRYARTKFESRQREELKRLREEVNALKTQLDDAFHSHSVEWKAYKLAAEKSLRVTAIHAMADRQYDRMESAFIRAGLNDQTEDLFRAQFLPQPNGTTVYESVNRVTVTAPFQLSRDLTETLEVIDPCTVYSRKQTLATGNAKVAWQSNIIRKYFPENDRCVFVGRTVLEDELSPPKPTDVVEDKWVWLEVVPVDLCHCRLTALVQANFGVLPVLNQRGDCTNDVIDLINGLAITEGPLEPSNFPRLPEITAQDLLSLPIPHMPLFSEDARHIQRFSIA